MILHIVKEDEKVGQILDLYGITLDELKTNNMHITDFKNLRPGTRIKIPSISNENLQILSSTEPLVDKYYEKLGDESNEEQAEAVVQEPLRETEKNKTESFRGVNYIRPEAIEQKPISKRPIYPFFDKSNRNR